MEIKVYLRRLNYRCKKTCKMIDKLKSDGWQLIKTDRTLFVTYYSFSKII